MEIDPNSIGRENEEIKSNSESGEMEELKTQNHKETLDNEFKIKDVESRGLTRAKKLYNELKKFKVNLVKDGFFPEKNDDKKYMLSNTKMFPKIFMNPNGKIAKVNFFFNYN